MLTEETPATGGNQAVAALGDLRHGNDRFSGGPLGPRHAWDGRDDAAIRWR